MCRDVMSAVRARCPDCRAVIEMPYNWCPAPEHGGFLDEAAANAQLMEHARQMPILHPTLLPEHHLTRRPA